MNYIEYNFSVQPIEGAEILMAELGELPFESFVETEEGLLAYIQKEFWNEAILEDVFILKSDEFRISFQYKEIEQINWNQEWEKNFNPIEVDNLCTIRATFHPKPNTKYDIVIDPKMSFGTGHHETTHLMLQNLLKFNFTSKKVADVGCGTGILAILTAFLGAIEIDAIDIDQWCYENSLENIERNQVPFIKVHKGDASVLEGKKYDVIIANINRNILLNDIPAYTQSLLNGGKLFLSGFYVEDLEAISQKCTQCGLTYLHHSEKNNWVSAIYELK